MTKKEKSLKKKNKANIKKIFKLYSKHKSLFFVTMTFSIIAGALGIFMPIFSANALAFLADGKFDLSIKSAIIMCILGIARSWFHGLNNFFYVKLTNKVRMDLTIKVINSINSTKVSKLETTGMGVFSERLFSDIGKVSEIYIDMLDVVFEIITNVVFLIYIAFLNVYLFLILLGYVVILYVVCSLRSKYWVKDNKEYKKQKEIYISSYMEQINGIKDLKLLDIKDNVTNYSNKKFENTLGVWQKFNNRRNIFFRIEDLITTIFGLVFLSLGITFIRKELLLLSGFLVIYAYQGRVNRLVSFVSSLKEYVAEGNVMCSRIFEVIEDFEKEKFGTRELKDFSGKVELKNVKFSYGDEPVLEDVNMEFEPGKITALVGKSGAGKSTILSLLSKLYDKKSGRILLDNYDINTLSEKSIRSSVGVVSQSPYIFNATIRQNLLFVKEDATDEELFDVLKKAQIYKDVKRFKNGLDTEIGENGVKLSGGQRQRIAIARLLLKKDKVLIFDEATSSLDNISQAEIVDLLNKLKYDKTIIIVAHRLSTIVDSDKIYMLDDGKVIAQGTHKELMRTCKEYNELYKYEEKIEKEEVKKEENKNN